MSIPKLLELSRNSLQNNGTNVITDGSIGLNDSSNNDAHFNLTLNGISDTIYEIAIGTTTTTARVAYQGSQTIQYSSQVVANSDGSVSLINPISLSVTADGSDLSSDTKTLLYKKYLTNFTTNPSIIYYSDEYMLGRTMGDGAYVVELPSAKEVSTITVADNSVLVEFSNSNDIPVRLSNIAEPANATDAVNREYVDQIDTGVITVNGEKGDISDVAKTTGSIYTGSLITNGASDLTVGQARNIYCSMFEPTASDGNTGDLWIIYSNA